MSDCNYGDACSLMAFLVWIKSRFHALARLFDTFEIYGKLIHSCVMPVLDYGAEVWGSYKCAEIEKVQNTAARIFLGVSLHQFLLFKGTLDGDYAKQD